MISQGWRGLKSRTLTFELTLPASTTDLAKATGGRWLGASVDEHPDRIILGLEAGWRKTIYEYSGTEMKTEVNCRLGARAGFIALPDLAPSSSLDPQLGLEVETKLALGSTGSSEHGGRSSYLTSVPGWRIQLLARLKSSSAWTPHLVVGVGGETLLTSSPFIGDDTDDAFHWGPGVSRHLFGRWDLRVDLRQGLTAGRVAGVVSTFELQAGLSTGWDLHGHHAAAKPDAARAPTARTSSATPPGISAGWAAAPRPPRTRPRASASRRPSPAT